jgi:hypothetical protein
MSDAPEFEDFGSSAELLKFIQERSEDIERAEILCPGLVLTYMGQPVAPLKDFAIMLHMSDKRRMIVREDAEILLNDGILNRMKIRIEFFKTPKR